MAEREVKYIISGKDISGSAVDSAITNQKRLETNNKSVSDKMSEQFKKSEKSFRDFTVSIASSLYIFDQIKQFFSPVVAIFEKGFFAVENFNQAVASLAAMVMSFADKQKGASLSKQWEDSYNYANAMVPILENIAAQTLLSGEETTALANAFARSGVFLDATNQKQVESFKIVSNALPLLTQGQEIMRQINTEIRALMMGTNESTSMLLTTLKAIDPEIEKHLKTWRAEGTVLEHIGELLSGFGPATQLLENQWQTVKSTIDTTATQALRGGMKGAYDEIIASTKSLNGYLVEHKTEVQSGIHKAWLLVKGSIETVLAVLKPIQPLLKDIGDVSGVILNGWGMLAYTVIPVIADRLGTVLSAITETVAGLIDVAKYIGEMGAWDFSAAAKSADGLKEHFRNAGKDAGSLFSSSFGDEVANRYSEWEKTMGGMADAVKPPQSGSGPDTAEQEAQNKQALSNYKAMMNERLKISDEIARRSLAQSKAIDSDDLSEKLNNINQTYSFELLQLQAKSAALQGQIPYLNKIKDSSDEILTVQGEMKLIDEQIKTLKMQHANDIMKHQQDVYKKELADFIQMQNQMEARSNERAKSEIQSIKQSGIDEIAQINQIYDIERAQYEEKKLNLEAQLPLLEKIKTSNSDVVSLKGKISLIDEQIISLEQNYVDNILEEQRKKLDDIALKYQNIAEEVSSYMNQIGSNSLSNVPIIGGDLSGIFGALGDNAVLKDKLNEQQRLYKEMMDNVIGYDDNFQSVRTNLADMYSKNIVAIEKKQFQQKLQIGSMGFNAMAQIAAAFYEASGRENETAFAAYKALMYATTVVSTASGIMQVWASPELGYWAKWAASAALALAGATQLMTIANTSPGTSATVQTPGGSAPVVAPVSSSTETPKESARAVSYSITVMGNIIDQDAFARELMYSLRKAEADNV